MRLFAPLLLAGCGSTLQLMGAATLEPRQTEFSVAVSDGAGFAPLFAGSTGPSIPAINFAYRRGLKPDVDFGVRFGTGGIGTDVRYRFFRQGHWHLATGAGVLLSPDINPLSGAASFHFDLRAPLLAEYDITPGWSIAAGPSVLMRTQTGASGLTGGLYQRADLLGTFHLRTELRPRGDRHGFAFVIGAEIIDMPLRTAPIGWELGAQFVWRNNPWVGALRHGVDAGEKTGVKKGEKTPREPK